jgi:pyruvate kinase
MFLKSTYTRIQCTCKELPRIVKPNDVIYLDDGKLVFLVIECEQVSIMIVMLVERNPS